MDATTVAVDLAKDVFEVALANRAGRVVERKRLTRAQFERFIERLTPGTDVVMEACGTAHYWGACVRLGICRSDCYRANTSGRTSAATKRTARIRRRCLKPIGARASIRFR